MVSLFHPPGNDSHSGAGRYQRKLLADGRPRHAFSRKHIMEPGFRFVLENQTEPPAHLADRKRCDANIETGQKSVENHQSRRQMRMQLFLSALSGEIHFIPTFLR
jgi:hypothetical protein